MALKIGDEAPNFQAQTTEGQIDFHDWIGDSWAVLFSHPKDFTPVCTTELGYMAKIKPEFDRRNVKVIGLSVDSTGDHEGWVKDIEETQGEAPNFTADTTEGSIDFHEWLGDSWGILFSHPKDFTPVCTTELGYVAKLKPEWDKRNVKVLGLSVDSSENHETWSNDIEETQGTKVNFPLISDPDKKVSDLYDMIHPNASDTVTVRTVFIVGPDKKVKATLTYPQSAGRNFDEILRLVDSLQLSAGYSVSTPVNWKDGEDVIIQGTVSDEEAKTKFPKGWKAVKPYMRLTPQPNR